MNLHAACFVFNTKGFVVFASEFDSDFFVPLGFVTTLWYISNKRHLKNKNDPTTNNLWIYYVFTRKAIFVITCCCCFAGCAWIQSECKSKYWVPHIDRNMDEKVFHLASYRLQLELQKAFKWLHKFPMQSILLNNRTNYWQDLCSCWCFEISLESTLSPHSVIAVVVVLAVVSLLTLFDFQCVVLCCGAAQYINIFYTQSNWPNRFVCTTFFIRCQSSPLFELLAAVTSLEHFRWDV